MSNIILPGDPEYSSYSDDTTVDSRLVGRARLPIYASVDRGDSLAWFHTLRSHVPDVRDEVKSTHILQILDTLTPSVTEQVWRGLEDVAVTIVDPRAYADVFKDIWRSATGKAFREAELRHRATNGDPLAKRVLDDYRTWMANLIVDDSLPARLEELVVVAVRHQVYPGGHSTASSPPKRRTPNRLGEAVRSSELVRKAVDYAAKSGPALVDAYQRGRYPTPPDPRMRQFSTIGKVIAESALDGLRSSHAFDRGDSELLGRLRSERTELAGRLRALCDPWSAGEEVGQLGELDSTGSYRVQAADIAAGIARRLFEREGLPAVVKRFKRVMLNGARVSERNLTTVVRGAS